MGKEKQQANKKTLEAQEVLKEEKSTFTVDTHSIAGITETPAGIIVDSDESMYTLLHNTTSQIIESIGSLEELEERTKRAEEVFAANYEDQYKAGDLSFLVDSPEGITDNPPELLPAIERELQAYKQEKGLAELPLISLLFGTDPDSGRDILDLIMERAGGNPPIAASKESQEPGAGELSIPNLHPIIPKYYTMPNSKLADKVGDLINEGETGVKISGNKKREVITPVDITMLDTEGIKIDGTFTEFDRQVQNAIISIYLDGSTSGFFTAETVLRVMTNNKNGKLNKQTVGAVTKSIEKQRIIHAECDISSITKQRGYDVQKDSLGRMLLVLDDRIVKIGGVKKKGYYIKDVPIIYEYSVRIGNQIATVPAYLLDIQPVNNSKTKLIGGNISDNQERIAIRGYLLRRIAIIKHDNEQAKDALRQYKKKQAAAKKKGDPLPDKSLSDFRKEGNRILYDSVFAAAGVTGKSAQTLFNYKSYIKLCLDNWTIEGYISGYKVIAGKRKDSETAVDILLK